MCSGEGGTHRRELGTWGRTGQPQEAVSFWPWFPRPRIYKTSFPWLGALRDDVRGSALSLGKRCLWAVTCSGPAKAPGHMDNFPWKGL